MSRYFYDVETNGLIPQVSTLHSICLKDMDDRSKLYSACIDQSYVSKRDAKVITLWEALNMMATADELCGHNILGYDELALRKLINRKLVAFPGITEWSFPIEKQTDTLTLSRLGWPDMKGSDFAFLKRNPGLNIIPGKLIGSHSLKAWGYRLKIYKGDFSEDADWSTWTPEMQDYCEQDVIVTEAIYDRARKQLAGYGFDISIENRPEWLKQEHMVHFIVARQSVFGFHFDQEKADRLEMELRAEFADYSSEMSKLFLPWWSAEKEKTPDKDRRQWVAHECGTLVRDFKATKTKPARTERGFYMEYTAGSQCTLIKLNVFNPTSRAMIVNRLKYQYDWKPVEFTDAGQPKVDDDILNAMPYPPAKKLARLFMLSKRLGALVDGKPGKNWMSCVEEDGRIHGYVNTLGAVTNRMTHSFPNIAQVPSIHNAKGEVPYGRACRELFSVPKGRKLVGGDAGSLELVCLAHYMARYDDGAYAVSVSSGTKEEGTDPHTMNQKAAGLPSRDTAKTFIYAFLYGAGDAKIGSIVLPEGSEAEQAAAGKRLKAKFLKQTPALAKLIKKVKEAAKKGWFLGLDGRRLKVRHAHAALNTLLQSAGAIIMKQALVILDDRLQTVHGFTPGVEYEFVANVHDEFQIETDEDLAELVGQEIVKSIELAGEYFELRCPLTGDYAVGDSWADTH